MNISQDIPLSDAEFALIQKLVFKLVGITLDDSKRSLVKNRLMKRLTFYGMSKYSDYVRIVQFNRDEAAEMVNQITTNETYFFREPPHFEFLKRTAAASKGDTFLRVWSAAASLGAEAYSIAMVLDSIVGALRYEVVGTDINSEVLNIAKAGCYPLPWVDKISDAYKQAYCLKGKNEYERQFLIDLQLQKNVSFSKANLLDKQTHLGVFDIIFLRNVLIYFNDEIKALVIDNILNNLREGGYLIISLTENLRSVANPKLKQVDSSIYQKVML
ncbi:MAG: protein-glutamate O-methyltransferase CheR [Sulfurimonas sp.]|nr:protein-glutamate O-methyltransferase CheR [Sulfurimonas sp.]MDD5202520.1 protein-glutamate O-methyltransferase CheR [Sulfurimonas sp.]